MKTGEYSLTLTGAELELIKKLLLAELKDLGRMAEKDFDAVVKRIYVEEFVSCKFLYQKIEAVRVKHSTKEKQKVATA